MSSMLDDIRNRLTVSLNAAFKNQEMKPETGSMMKELASEILGEIITKSFRPDIRLDVVEDGQMVNIKPKNLFTLLLMNGILVTPAELKGKVEWETPGAMYSFKNGEPSVYLKKPLDFIQVSFSMEEKAGA